MITFPEQDAIVTNCRYVNHQGKAGQTILTVNHKCEVMTALSKISPSLVDDDFIEGLESRVQLLVAQTKKHTLEIQAHELAFLWDRCQNSREDIKCIYPGGSEQCHSSPTLQIQNKPITKQIQLA